MIQINIARTRPLSIITHFEGVDHTADKTVFPNTSKFCND